MNPPGIFANPVDGLVVDRPDGWVRPSGDTSWNLTQPFGPTTVAGEPTVTWTSADSVADGGTIPPGTFSLFHQGIDLGQRACGAAFRAAKAGTVTVKRSVTASVNSPRLEVYVDHGDGWLTRYLHMSSFATGIVVGAKVAAGQLIGPVGTSGATACHAHFATFQKNSAGVWRPRNPWRRLAQNVTVRPSGDGINLRTDANMGPVYATTRAGRIVRSDGVDLGAVSTMRPWLGQFVGAAWTVGTATGTTWQAVGIDGKTLYVATGLAIRSV